MQSTNKPAVWRNLVSGSLGPLLALVMVIAFFGIADTVKNDEGSFLTAQNFRTVSVQMSTVAVAALGMTLVIIAGGIDLSAGTALALSATTMAWSLKAGWGVPAALAAAIGIGMLAGFVNGLLISTLRVVPFIVSLGTMTAYLGLAKVIAKESTVRPDPSQIPEWLGKLVSVLPKDHFLLATCVWIGLALAVALAAVLRYTVFGRYVFAIGSNEATARLCGVPVTAVKIAVYTLAGFFVGIAGIYQFARLSSGNPTSGIGLELKIIAAVVIGGGSLSGGRGSVVGTLAGAAMMQVIASGCTLLGLSNPLQDVIIGVIIVAAVTVDQWRVRRMS
ncbi:MAG: ABC transporter permease [Planctomycetaceae bacterium]|nr:ABC transporter permease [Planctomycetaceae bacterium]